MATVKTAVSLPEALLTQVDRLAKELEVSRSRLFALALSDLVRRHQSHELLARINKAYGEGDDGDEMVVRQRMREYHRRMVEGEW